MECIIKPEDKENLFDLAEILKSDNRSEHMKTAMLWYARGQADALMMQQPLQPTGT